MYILPTGPEFFDGLEIECCFNTISGKLSQHSTYRSTMCILTNEWQGWSWRNTHINLTVLHWSITNYTWSRCVLIQSKLCAVWIFRAIFLHSTYTRCRYNVESPAAWVEGFNESLVPPQGRHAVYKITTLDLLFKKIPALDDFQIARSLHILWLRRIGIQAL